jgi:putative ABC transport system substrate-binding protein
VRRREFIAGLGLAAAVPTISTPVEAQHGTANKRIPRIGILWHAGNPEEEKEYLTVLTKTFSDLGYEDGKSVELLHRFPAEQPDKFRFFAEELAAAKPDVLIAVTHIAAVELKRATTSIPTVFILIQDPVKDGFVQSLSRPGGNMTGTSLMASDLSGKRLSLMREAIPGLRRIALIFDFFGSSPPFVTAFQNRAREMGLTVDPIQVLKPDDIELAFSAIGSDGTNAAFVVGSLLWNERRRVGMLSSRYKVPTCAIVAEMIPYGLLMSYGQDLPDYFRKAAATAVKDS